MQKEQINTRYGFIEWFPSEQWDSEVVRLYKPLMEEDSLANRLLVEQARWIFKDLVISGFQDVLEQSIREFEIWVTTKEGNPPKMMTKKKAAKCAYDASLKRLASISFRRREFSFDEYFDNLSAAENKIKTAIRDLLHRPQPINPTQNNVATKLGWGNALPGEDNVTGGRMVRRYCNENRLKWNRLIAEVKAEQKPDRVPEAEE